MKKSAVISINAVVSSVGIRFIQYSASASISPNMMSKDEALDYLKNITNKPDDYSLNQTT